MFKKQLSLVMMGLYQLANNIAYCSDLVLKYPLIIEDLGFYQLIHFQSQMERVFKAQIDTGSCNLVVPHEICERCQSPVKYTSLPDLGIYQYMNSVMPIYVQITAITKPHCYIGKKIKTVQVRDWVVYDPFKNIRFKVSLEVATWSQDTNKWTGILGLCPQNDQRGINDLELAVTYLGQYYDQERFEQRNTLPLEIKQSSQRFNQTYNNIFSIYLDKERKQNSQIIYGDLHWKLKAYESEIQYLKNFEVGHGESNNENSTNNYQSKYWQVKFDSVSYGDYKIESQEVNKVIFDTGCTLHQASKSFIDKIIEIAGLEVLQRGESVITKCSAEQFEQIPPLIFKVQGKTITIHKEIWARNLPKYNVCAFAISELPSSWTDTFVLGYDFFKYYFTVFDNEENRIGMFEYKNIRKSFIESGIDKAEDLYNKMSKIHVKQSLDHGKEKAEDLYDKSKEKAGDLIDKVSKVDIEKTAESLYDTMKSKIPQNPFSSIFRKI